MASPNQATPELEVIVQRPSTEVERTESDEKKPEAATFPPAPSPLALWLKENGLPLNIGRMKKKKNDDSERNISDAKPKSSQVSITASNVTTQELERHYKWSFQEAADSVPDNMRISCRDILEKIDELFGSKESQPQHAFNLPSEWFTPEGLLIEASSNDQEAFWRQNLKTFLNAHDPNNVYVKLCPQKDIEAAKFPEANILNMRNEKLEGGGIAWDLTNILASPTFRRRPGPRSEMEVERLHGCPLSGFFNIPECETTSNVDLVVREELACFGSHSRPDFAARVMKAVIPVNLSHDLYPVTILGESKRRYLQNLLNQAQAAQRHKKQDPIHLQVPSEMDNGLEIPQLTTARGNAKLPMAAQLAFSAYPSLVLIIASLITEWKHSPPKPKGKKRKSERPMLKDYQTPEHAIIYGIGYASNGFLVYAFFPYVRALDKNNFPSDWGFMSVLASNEFYNVFEAPNIHARFRAIRILSMLQQHGKRLKDRIKAVKDWPKEFLD